MTNNRFAQQRRLVEPTNQPRTVATRILGYSAPRISSLRATTWYGSTILSADAQPADWVRLKTWRARRTPARAEMLPVGSSTNLSHRRDSLSPHRRGRWLAFRSGRLKTNPATRIDPAMGNLAGRGLALGACSFRALDGSDAHPTSFRARPVIRDTSRTTASVS